MNEKNNSGFRYWPQIIVVCLLIFGYGCYRYFAYYDTRSNDAFISAHVVNIAPLVSGPVTHIYVKENQKVKKGDKLLEIDPQPYIYAVEQAKAKLNSAQLKYDNEALANRDDSDILSAKAQLSEANYLVQHTTLTAPEAGYITNFNVRKGQYLSVGEGLCALIETAHWWVETRYKETVLRLIKPGDKAKIMIDMYPGKVFHGHVKSIGWGINRVQKGNVTNSTLVYMEATEDWIRIAQRFPVHIAIDDLTDEYPLRIGASATSITYR